MGPRRSSGLPDPSCALNRDPGTQKSDAGANRVSGARGAGWGLRAKAEPRLEGAESGGDCFNLHPSTFIHPQRLAPVGHRTGLKGRVAVRGNPETAARTPGCACACACAAPPLPPPLLAPPSFPSGVCRTHSLLVCFPDSARRVLKPFRAALSASHGLT